MIDPALSMTLDDLRFIASIDDTLHNAARNAELLAQHEAARDGNCDDGALD